MKTRQLTVLFLLISLLGCTVESRLREFRKLGTAPFSKDAWAEGNSEVRGTMIYDFLKKNWPITEKKRDFILDQLGEPTAYAGQEYYPAYDVSPMNSLHFQDYRYVSFIVDPSGRITHVYLEPDSDDPNKIVFDGDNFKKQE